MIEDENDIIISLPDDRKWRTTREIWKLISSGYDYSALRRMLSLMSERGLIEKMDGDIGYQHRWRRNDKTPVLIKKRKKTIKKIRNLDKADYFKEYRDQHSASVVKIPPEKRTKRPCLSCGKIFESRWIGNRLCGCRGS